MFWEGSEGDHSRSSSARTRYAIGKVREVSSNGAMDEGSGKAQKASTHVVLRKRDTRSKRSGKGHPTGDGRRFRKSSEGEHSRRPAQTRYKIEKVMERSSNGVMDEGPGRVQKASAHPISFIVMYLAVVESHIAVIDVQPPALPNKEGTCHGKGIQRGDGCNFWAG